MWSREPLHLRLKMHRSTEYADRICRPHTSQQTEMISAIVVSFSDRRRWVAEGWSRRIGETVRGISYRARHRMDGCSNAVCGDYGAFDIWPALLNLGSFC
jgi:hypothetical protein